ncbi:MAG: phage terminase small subunit [Vulcanibacillus sp.]
MARASNPNRKKAYELWLEHNGAITNRRIAELLNENEKVIAVWKQRDKWNVVQQSDSKVVQQKKNKKLGAPIGNKNAKGNKGGLGGPLKNDKAVKHGFFQKYFPEEAIEIMQEIESQSPLDILWDNIVIQYTAIVRAQRIMFVRDQKDQTKVLKRQKESLGIGGSSSWEKEYELQHAWDKHASFLQAQSRAMGELRSLIKQYEELCNSGLASEEQKLRIEKLKAEVKALGSISGDEGVKIIDDIGSGTYGG